MIIKKYYKMVRVSYADSDLFQINNITNEVGTITVSNQNIIGTLQYSTDGVNFTTASFSNNVCEIELPAGGNCYFKGTNFIRSYRYENTVFNCSVNHNVRGNLYSIVDPVNYVSATASEDYMFYYLFYNNTHLVDASGLMLPVGVTSIGNSGLRSAFSGCSSLISSPDLSNVTTLGSTALTSAFEGCSSLISSPDLSNVTTLGSSALSYAFQNCSSLISSPDLSNVTTLGSTALSYAFKNCSNLQTIYVPNVSTWNVNSQFYDWVSNAGTSAATPKQMIFQTQALLDACPSGNSGYGGYERVLA